MCRSGVPARDPRTGLRGTSCSVCIGRIDWGLFAGSEDFEGNTPCRDWGACLRLAGISRAIHGALDVSRLLAPKACCLALDPVEGRAWEEGD